MRLKGQQIKLGKKEYVLKQQLGEGGFSMIYQTNFPQIICKVQVLANAQIIKAYNKQKQLLTLLAHPNIVKLYDSGEVTIKDQKYGLIFMENCNCGTAFNVLEKSEGVSLNEKKIIKILLVVANVLQHLHKKGFAHRDIKMQNVLINSQGEYKLCDFGSCSQTVITKVDASNRVDIEQYIEKTTTPLYRSPEQLDLYSGYQIGTKVDIFALGVLAFIMSFQKPPFQSRLSAINKQYFIPDNHCYSAQFVSFIQKCFTTNPSYRPTATEAKAQLTEIYKLKKIQIDLNHQREFQQTLKQISRVTEANLRKNQTVAETGFFDKIKRIYNQITTQTEGWIAGFIEDNEQAPLLKYNRSIISKCYEKRYKIQKVYELIWKYSQQYKNKSLVILKLLILLHNFLRKGPSEAIIYDKQNSPIKLCIKIYKLWKTSLKSVDEDDIKRNTFICLLIRCYCLVIINKVQICYQHSNLIQANFSVVPYLTHIKQNTILKLNFISSMIQFLDKCVELHDNVQRVNYLNQIQKSIILSMIDQEYCLISTLTFVLSAFKLAVCYVKEQIDLMALQIKINEIEDDFERVYRKLAGLIEKSQKNGSLFENSQHINLSLEVIRYIRNIKIQKKQGQFSITDHLNYKNSICGLKIPLTYQEVVKNPNFLKDLEKVQTHSKNVIQVNQFKVKKQISNSSSSHQVKKEQPIKNVKSEIKSSSTAKDTLPEMKKQKSSQSSPNTGFNKPKETKDKIFQNFTFDQKKNSPQIPDNKKNNMMEFTHQNLNKDFISIDLSKNVVSQKNDQFKDFFSIVQVKFQKQKQAKKTNQIPPQINKNSNASKQVFCSENKGDINKIELMNFFFDEEQTQKQSTKSIYANMITSKNNYLIDIGQQEPQIIKEPVQKQAIENKLSSKVHQNLIPLEQTSQQNFKTQQKTEQVEIVVPNQKTFKTSPPKENNLIDLKEFIVEQVRKNAQQYIIDFGTLIFKQKIGYGNSSQVFKGECRGREIAIKKIKDNMNSPRLQKQFKRQIMTSVRIRHHPQLVTLIGVCEHDKYFYIINEYCNGSTLFDLLHQSNDKLPWNTRINMAKQIAKGMLFLHTNDPPIIHRDLKSLNVLLVNKYDPNNPDLVQIKIADFGLSRDYASTYMTGTLGTYHWMAPQIFNNQPYTLKADVYSYGIVLWEIASRVPPYTNMKNPQSLMKFVTVQNGRPDMNFVDRECPMEMRMLMIRCWDKFPSNRPNFSEILTCLEYLSK